MRTRIGLLVLVVLTGLLAYVWWGRIPANYSEGNIGLPAGFRISIFADGISGARGIAVADSGAVFVTSRDEGAVYLAMDRNSDGRADEVRPVLRDLSLPHGLAYHRGDLWVGAVGTILRVRNVVSHLRDSILNAEVIARLPADSWHGYKPIAIGPDNRLYVGIGAPCNVCDRGADGFARIVSMDLDGRNRAAIATGVRNSVGFDWDPRTGHLWFTDNGRDWLGNDEPPDELNVVVEPGGDYGFPGCHGGYIEDSDFSDGDSCDAAIPPALRIDAHVAPLGMVFYDGNQFPEEYRNRVFIAEHGSWNRLPPAGYRITVATVSGETATDYRVFASGWLRGGRASGRPVDVAVDGDGALLATDDMNGYVYRIEYSGN